MDGNIYMMAKYMIYEHIGNISESNNGWVKELNKVAWGAREPVYDIRTWNFDHTKYGKGVTITRLELKNLYKLLSDIKVI